MRINKSPLHLKKKKKNYVHNYFEKENQPRKSNLKIDRKQKKFVKTYRGWRKYFNTCRHFYGYSYVCYTKHFIALVKLETGLKIYRNYNVFSTSLFTQMTKIFKQSMIH